MILINNPQELQSVLQESTKVVLLVTSPTCIPCANYKKVLPDLESEYLDVTFLNIDGPSNRDWATENNIRTVPTTIIYNTEDDTKTVITGFVPDTISKIKSYLNNM